MSEPVEPVFSKSSSAPSCQWFCSFELESSTFQLPLIEDLLYTGEPARCFHTLSHSDELPLSVSESMKMKIYLFTHYFFHKHSLRVDNRRTVEQIVTYCWVTLAQGLERPEFWSRVGCGSTQSKPSGPKGSVSRGEEGMGEC